MKRKHLFIVMGLLLTLTLASCTGEKTNSPKIEITLPENFSFVYSDLALKTDEEGIEKYHNVVIDFNHVKVVVNAAGLAVEQTLGEKLKLIGPGVREDGTVIVSEIFNDSTEWDVDLSYYFEYDNGRQILTSEPINLTFYRLIEKVEIVGDFVSQVKTLDDFTLLNSSASVWVTFVGDYPAELYPINEKSIDFSNLIFNQPNNSSVFLKYPYQEFKLADITVSYHDLPNYVVEAIIVGPNEITVRADIQGLKYGISESLDGDIVWQDVETFGGLSPNKRYYIHTYFDDSLLYGTTEKECIAVDTIKYTYDHEPLLNISAVTSDSIKFEKEPFDTVYFFNGIEFTPKVIDDAVIFEGLTVNTLYSIEAYYVSTDTIYESVHSVLTQRTLKHIGSIDGVWFSNGTNTVTYNGINRQVGYIENTFNLPLSDFNVSYFDSEMSSVSRILSAGKYYVTVSCKLTDYDYEVFTSELFVLQQKVTIQLDSIVAVYGETLAGFGYVVQSGAIIQNDDLGISYLIDGVDISSIYYVSDYTISGTCSNENYDVTIIDGGLTVNQKGLDLIIDETVFEYSKVEVKLGYSLVGVVGFDSVTVDLVYDSLLSAGIYSVEAVLDSHNYYLVERNFNVEILKKNISIAYVTEIEYNGAIQEPTYSLIGNLEDIAVDFTISGLLKNVGTYNITARSLDQNYSISTDEQTITIVPSSITIALNPSQVIYGDEYLLDFTVISGLYYLDDLLIEIFYTNLQVGLSTVSGSSANPNYDVVINDCEIEIVPRNVTIQISSSRSIYGDSPTFVYILVAGNLIGSDDLGINYSCDGIHVGSYQITATTDNLNYDCEVISGILEIAPRPLTIQINDYSIIYGSEPVYSYRITDGLVINQDDLLVEFFPESLEMGLHVIYGVSNNPNYDCTFIDGVLAVNSKAIEISFKNYLGFIYDGKKFAIEFDCLTELEEVVQFSIVYSSDPIDAGRYTATVISLDKNYTVIDNTLEFEIAQRDITVTINDSQSVFGDTPIFTSGVLNLANGDSLQLIYTASGSEVGVHEISATFTNSNYNATIISGELTITRRPITLSFSNFNGLIYNGTVQTPSVIVDNALGFDPVLAISYSREAINVGQYRVTVESLNNNLELIDESTYDFTIAKKGIEINLLGVNLGYGDYTSVESSGANSYFTYVIDSASLMYSLTGLCPIDSDIATTLIIILKALSSAGANVGQYDANSFEVILSELDNYEVINTNGEFVTIAPRIITVQIGGGEITYGEGFNYSFTIVDGTVLPADLLTIEYYLSSRNVGVNTISASSLNPNYLLDCIDGTLIINKALLTITVVTGKEESFVEGDTGMVAYFSYNFSGLLYDDLVSDFIIRIEYSYFVDLLNNYVEISPFVVEENNSNYDYLYVDAQIQFSTFVRAFLYNNPVEAPYRVGTINDVSLKLLPQYQTEFGINYSFETIQGTASASIRNNIISFTGYGIVEVSASFGDVDFIPVRFLVLEGGINVSSDNQLPSSINGFVCLHDDVTSSRAISVSETGTIFGNNYSISATKESFSGHNGNFVSLRGKLDSVKIIGLYVDDFYASSSLANNVDNYYKSNATVRVIGNNAVIENCYIEGGKFALRFYSDAGDTLIRNTTINGGAISVCIECSGEMTLVFENLTIIQIPETGKGIGAGFVIWENAQPNIKFIGEMNFHTFINEQTKTQLSGDFATAFDRVWKNSEFKHVTYQGTEYLHYYILVTSTTNYKNFDFSQSTLAGRQVIQKSQTISLLGISQSATVFMADHVSEANYLIGLLDSGYLLIPSFKDTPYNELEPITTGVNKSFLFVFERDSDSLSINLSLEAPVSFKKYGYDLNYSISFETILGTGDGVYSYQDDYLEVRGGKCWLKVTYLVYDNFDDKMYTYSNVIYFNTPRKLPTISITPKGTTTTANTFVESSAANPSGLNFSGVDFMKAGTRSGNLLDYDITYNFCLKDDFNVSIIGYDDQDRAYSIDSLAVVTIYGMIASYSTVQKLFTENRPAGLTDTSKRFTQVFSFTITVEYEGLVVTQEYKIAYYVDKITGKW